MTATTTQPARTTTPTTTASATGAAPAGGSVTVFDTPAGALDAHTHEGLRAALGLVQAQGWEGQAGRAVLAALSARCGSWAGWRVRASQVGPGALDPGEVLSLGWLTLARFSERVAAADAPWAYLWRSVQRALAVEVGAEQVLSRTAVERPPSRWPHAAVRYGLAANALRGPDADGPDAGDEASAAADETLSPALAALVDHLGAGDFAQERFWAAALTRAVDVMAGARRSYEEIELRRDAYLREVLGLSEQDLSALAALLIGPRRGDRTSASLLLALHRDPATDPADIDGAQVRIRQLTAHRRALGVARTPAALAVAA